ncbi:hypothetical protein CALCODRAFT_429402 [Calocera cornea HHB12733]|uniref:EI24-domain-containing protein n=1 Tax=Calocera cornea HHB12733 TaxID=1353952 RepID=A0A165IBQ8_9BASI|nr:hypothetical protein CALCODRAFT_429402 [Calocera cornea HHB12733]
MSSSAPRQQHRLRPTPSTSSHPGSASPSPSPAPSSYTPTRTHAHAPSSSITASRPTPARLPSGHSARSPSYGVGVGASSYAYTASSGREAYPTFLSVWQTARLHAGWAAHGAWDACRWDYVLRTVAGEPEIQMNVLKSLLLNGLSLVSIFTFDFLLLPLLPSERGLWYHRNLGALYQVLWLWPVVGASLWFNSIWSTTIARKAFTLQHGQPAVSDATSYGGMLNSIATSAYRFIFLLSYLFLQLCLAYVPLVGGPAGFVFTCWVNSYYCFEFVGIARGMTLSERIKHHEERWAYYLAFGLPSAALCMWGNSLANAASYALVFPAFTIMAMHASPVPRHPYAPVAPSPSPAHPSSPSAAGPTPALLSPFIPIRLPIFSPVIVVNELVVKALSVGTGRKRAPGAGRGSAGGQRWEQQTMEMTEEGTEMDMLRPRRKLD